jgi:hypothetical protein
LGLLLGLGLLLLLLLRLGLLLLLRLGLLLLLLLLRLGLLLLLLLRLGLLLFGLRLLLLGLRWCRVFNHAGLLLLHCSTWQLWRLQGLWICRLLPGLECRIGKDTSERTYIVKRSAGGGLSCIQQQD